MSDQQPVTPELRAWIIEQATAGHRPEVVLQSMRASGWNEDSAIVALETVLTGYLDEKAMDAVLFACPIRCRRACARRCGQAIARSRCW